MTNTTDVIVIGAGASGSAVAGRLVQAGRRVILLEAGGSDRNPIYRVPVMTGLLAKYKPVTWHYMSDPDPRLANREIWISQGRIMGGSSSINGMLWLRGRPFDYNGWAERGLPDWDWEHVAPALNAIETHAGGSPERGTNGPIPVHQAPARNPLYQAYFTAAEQAGFKRTNDLNAAPFEGVAPFDANIGGGLRWSAARAFLGPVRGSSNLRIVTKANATRLMIEKGAARGVVAQVGGAETKFYADEVVVCAGAIATPKLLMLSGIGPADALRAHGIAVAADLRGVGANFHDHVGVGSSFTTSGPLAFETLARVDKGALGFLRAILFGSGPAAMPPFSAGGLLKSSPDLAEPDFENVVVPTLGPPKLRLPIVSKPNAYGFAIASIQMRPTSRGTVSLRSADPADLPRIQPNYLSTQNDRDIVRNGLKITRAIIAQAGFDALRGDEVRPGKNIRTDAELDAWILANGSTCYHPVGTCRMGGDNDPDAVVDSQLRVRGIAGLRVGDASIMPQITSGNTHAPSIMIGYRCAGFMIDAPRN
jgi:choline dehydrogenase